MPKAVSAALTAPSTSSGVPRATAARVSSVEGFTTSNLRPERPGVHPPPMKSLSRSLEVMACSRSRCASLGEEIVRSKSRQPICARWSATPEPTMPAPIPTTLAATVDTYHASLFSPEHAGSAPFDGSARAEHLHGLLLVTRRYPVYADHFVYNDVLVAVQRLLKLVAHPATAVGRVGDALLYPLDDFDILQVHQVPEAHQLVKLFLRIGAI